MFANLNILFFHGVAVQSLEDHLYFFVVQKVPMVNGNINSEAMLKLNKKSN